MRHSQMNYGDGEATTMTRDSLVDLDEACKIVGVTSQKLYQLVDQGVVPAYLIENTLRFRERELTGLEADQVS